VWVVPLFYVPGAVGSAAFSAPCSYVVVVFGLDLLSCRECVGAYLWVVLYVMGLGSDVIGLVQIVLTRLKV